MSSFWCNLKLNQVAYFALIFVLVFFGVFSYDLADYSNYELIYKLSAAESGKGAELVEPGFLLLCKLFNIIGVPFPVFRGLYILTAICFLLKGLKFFNKVDSNVPLLLYIVFPFALDVVQYRFFLASAIVIYSIKYLEERKFLKYIVAVLFAATQQYAAVFYLLFLIVSLDKEKVAKIVFFMTIIELVLLPIIMELVFSRMGFLFMHYSDYSDSAYSRTLCVLYLFMTFAIVLFDYFGIKNNDSFDEFMQKILYLSVLLVPFIFLNENFSRLYRGVLLLIYCRLFQKTNDKRNVCAISVFAIVFCGFMFYFHLSPHNQTHWNRVMMPIFENNFIFDFFKDGLLW